MRTGQGSAIAPWSGPSGTLSLWPSARRWLTRHFGRLATRRTVLGGVTFAVSPAIWPATARCWLTSFGASGGPTNCPQDKPETLRKGACNMDINGATSKNKFKRRRGPLRSWLLAGALALGTGANGGGVG